MFTKDCIKLILGWSLLALAVRFAYLFEQGTTSVLFYQPLLDELETSLLADQLLRGEGFGPEPFFKSPFYTLFVAAVKFVTADGWFWFVRLIQHTCGALFVAITLDSARRILGPGRESRWVLHLLGAVLCFYAPIIRLENRLILDFFVVFFQSLMVWAIIRAFLSSDAKSRWYLAASTFAAIAWLTRPTLTVVIPFLILMIILSNGTAFNTAKQKKRLINSLKFACIFALMPLVAALVFGLRNQFVSGEFMILPWQGGYSFYVSNADDANGRYYLQKDIADSSNANPTKTIMLNQYIQNTQTPLEEISYAKVNQWWNQKAWKEISEEPGAAFKLLALKGLYLVNEREIFNFEEFRIHKNLSGILWLLPFGFGLIWPFAFASIAATPCVIRKGRRKFVYLLWCYALFLAGGIALYLVSGRLRMPLIFPAILLAGITLKFFLEQALKTRLGVRGGVAMVLLACGFVMSWGDWKGVRSENLDVAEYSRLSNAAFKSAEGQLALYYADLAKAADPDYPTINQQRAQALYLVGEYKEAAEEFKRAAVANPLEATPLYNLATILFDELNDYPAAATAYEAALRRDSQHARAAWGALKSHAMTGNLERARQFVRTLPNAVPLENWAAEALGARGVLAGKTGEQNVLAQIKEISKTRSAREQKIIQDDLAKIQPAEPIVEE